MKLLTEDDENDLWYMVLHRRRRNTLPWDRIEKRFPGIPQAHILQVVRFMEGQDTQLPARRLIPGVPWSDAEEVILAEGWGTRPMRDLMRLLPGRTRDAILKHAKDKGYATGVPAMPSTHVSVHGLSEDPKWGYGRSATQTILKWYGVRLEYFQVRGPQPGSPCVNRATAFKALAAWMAAETVRWASRRVGLRAVILWRWLEEVGRIKVGQRDRSLRLPVSEFNDLLQRFAHRIPGLQKRGPKPRVRLVLREDDQQEVRENAGQAAA